MYQACAPRKKKTNIVRKRTGCQNCRQRRRRCGEEKPECQNCLRRGIKCTGYQRALAFKDVSEQTAEFSRKFEAGRWAALREEDARRGQKLQNSQVEKKSPSGAIEDQDLNVVDAGQGSASTSFTHEKSESGQGSDDGSDGHGSLDCNISTSPPLGHDALSNGPASQGTIPKLDFDSGSLYELDAKSPASVLNASSKGETLEVDRRDSGICLLNDLDMADTFGAASSADLIRGLSQSKSVQNGAASKDFSAAKATFNPMNDPFTTSLLSAAPESALYTHFNASVVDALPVPFASRHRLMSNDCFRDAMLALSSANLSKLNEHPPQPIVHVGGPRGIEFYMSAIRRLSGKILNVSHNADEQEALAAASVFLAYYEMEVGTPLGVFRHADGVGAIVSRLKEDRLSISDAFRAWRVLRYDLRWMSMACRKSPYSADSFHVLDVSDPVLCIRDIYTTLHGTCERFVMERCFPHSPRPSEEVMKWMILTLNRKCDKRNLERGDYYKNVLTKEEVLALCDRYSAQLEKWHGALDSAGRPILQPGKSVPRRRGSIYLPPAITPVEFLDKRKGLDYTMYAMARLIINFLRSRLDKTTYTAALSENWCRFIMGCLPALEGLRLNYTYLEPSTMLKHAIMYCEGNTMSELMETHVLNPSLEKYGGEPNALRGYLFLKRQLDLLRKERHRGRAVRVLVNAYDEDVDRENIGSVPFVAFGDQEGPNGTEAFKECYFA